MALFKYYWAMLNELFTTLFRLNLYVSFTHDSDLASFWTGQTPIKANFLKIKLDWVNLGLNYPQSHSCWRSPNFNNLNALTFKKKFCLLLDTLIITDQKFMSQEKLITNVAVDRAILSFERSRHYLFDLLNQEFSLFIVAHASCLQPKVKLNFSRIDHIGRSSQHFKKKWVAILFSPIWSSW